MIKNKGPKCISIEEVISHCVSPTSNTSTLNNTIFYPNPTFGQISYTSEIIIQKITNAQGLKVSTSPSKNDIDLSALPAGIYFIHYTNRSNGKWCLAKLIKI